MKDQDSTLSRLIDLKQLAKMLNCSYSSARRIVVELKQIPRVRIFRKVLVDTKDVERFIEFHKEGGPRYGFTRRGLIEIRDEEKDRPSPQLLGLKEVAEMLKCSIHTAKSIIVQNNEIPRVRTLSGNKIFVERKSVIDWMENYKKYGPTTIPPYKVGI